MKGPRVGRGRPAGGRCRGRSGQDHPQQDNAVNFAPGLEIVEQLEKSVAVVLGRIQDLAELKEDWDSYGSPRIARRAIVNAMSVAEIGMRLGLRGHESATVGIAPRVVPMSGGGVQLEWKGCEVCVEGDDYEWTINGEVQGP